MRLETDHSAGGHSGLTGWPNGFAVMPIKIENGKKQIKLPTTTLECISRKKTGSRRFLTILTKKRFTLEEGIRLSRGGLALWLTYLYHHRFEIVVNEERERERE